MQTDTPLQTITIDPNWRIGVVRSHFNEEMTQGLLDKCLEELKKMGFQDDQVDVVEVPGAFEIPLICKKLATSNRYDALVTLGVVIKGDTNHFDMIMNEVSRQIMDIMVDHQIPIIYEVIGCYTEEDAVARTSNDNFNKGKEAAHTVVKMLEVCGS